tara:strand:+ start:4107 stop:4415 length:309 start_codon:yes stop_codon:yes gene_type:complete
MITFFQHLVLIILVLISISSICIYIYCIKQRIRENVNRIYRENLEQREMIDMLESVEETNNNSDLEVPPLPDNDHIEVVGAIHEIQDVEVIQELEHAEVLFE